MNSVSVIQSGHFDPEAIRELVGRAKAQGLIKGGDRLATPIKADPRKKVAIAKDGAPAADLADTVPGTTGAPVDGLVSQWMEVDPGLAAHWLQNNFRNRPLSEEVVKAYARDMINGEWVETHQGIAFNDLDELIDGQHRLNAVILANVTVKMMVTFGLPSKIEGSEMTTMDAVDRGRTRSVADQLKIQHGMKNGSAIASNCTTLGGLCFQDRTRRLSVGQTIDIYRAFQLAVDFVIEHRTTRIGLRATGVQAAFAFAITALEDRPRQAVMGYYRSLVDGVLETGTPMQLLRAFLTSDEAKLLNRGTDRGLAELVLHAIHLELTGTHVDLLEPSTAGADYFRSLQPDRVAKIAAIFNLAK